MSTGAEALRSSIVGRATRLTRDIRAKLLFLTLVCALTPLTAVGVFSYRTARSIIVEKVYAQLLAQAASSEQRLRLALAERAAETEVFATALLVRDSLEQWRRAKADESVETAERARDRLERYLTQVRERYPLYRGLLLLDSEKRVVAGTGTLQGEAGQALSPSAPGFEADLYLDRSGAEPTLLIRKQVSSQGGSLLGSLRSISGLAELWPHVSFETGTEIGHLRVIDTEGTILFDAREGTTDLEAVIPSRAQSLCRSRNHEVAEYRDESGEGVLGTCSYLSSVELGLLVEVNAHDAFAPSFRLRRNIFWISLTAAVATAAITWFLVVGMMRPVDALIAGAKAVSEGELEHRIPVVSADQIGFLTEAFNRMTEALQKSRAKLETLSGTDELTGLYNRRFLAKAFESELSRADRSGEALSLLMIDLDHFKDYNDRWGHLKGDEFLRGTADFLKEILRPVDVIVRYGGEEFLVLLSATQQDAATQAAERVRHGFADRSDTTGQEPGMTVSIGVATFPRNGTTERELVQAADGALYLAKKAGRNRVVTSQDTPAG